MHRYPYNVDRRSNVGLKLNRQPVCVNCNQGFSFKDPTFPIGARCPLLLNCGHSTCEYCIRSLLRSGEKSITCKLCTQSSTLPATADNADALRSEFPLNIFIVGQVALRGNRNRVEDNVVSFSKNKVTPNSAGSNSYDELCCECSEIPAGSLCRQCEVAYCDLCFLKVHKSAKSLQKHEKIPLVKKSQASGNFVFCKDHSGQKLEFFCKDCEVSTCAHCFICNHRNHDLITLKEKNEVVKADLATAYEDANKVLQRLHFTKKKIITTCRGSNSFDEESVQAEKAVSSHFSYLHGLLQLKETELLNNIRTAQSCTEQSLQEIAKELDSTIKEVEDLVVMGKAALDPNNLNAYDLVGTVTKLKDICELPCHLVLSQHLDETKPYKFEADDITKTLLEHCKLSVPEAKKWYLRTKNELPDDYQIEDIPPTSVKKTVPGESLVTEQSLPLLGKQQHKYNYSESEISTTSNESVRSSENFHRHNVSRLVEGSIEQVVLCHLLSPQDFYVHRKSSAYDLLSYSKQFSKCAAVKSKCPDTVTVGITYLVKFNTDNNWYRGRVLNLLEDDRVEIYYIDYGNTEKTSVKCLRFLPDRYQSLPALAIHCGLCDCIPVNGNWSSEAINIMANITSNVEMTMHIFRKTPSDIYEVDLSRKEIGVLSLRDALIFLGLATLSDLTHRIPMLKKDVFLDQQIKPGSSFTGLVTTVNSPAEFYVQRLDENGKYLENLMDEMNKMYCRKFTENHLVYTPTLGMPVAAQFTLDDKWYRAVVIGLPGQRKVEVFYVDYGNSEVLMWDRLRFLQEKFLRMSCQALKCSLCDIIPRQGSEWTTEVTSWFASYSDKKPLQVAVVADSKPTLKVVLYEQLPHSDVCINALLVKNGYASSTGENSTVVDFPRTIVEPTATPQIPSLMAHEFIPPKPKTAIKMRKPRASNVSESSVKSEKSKVSNLMSSTTTSCEKLSTTTEDDGEDLFRIPVTVLNVVSPGLFYVSISSQEKQIKNLGAEMAEFYSSVTSHNATWAVDNKFAMMRKSDRKWYRGVIIELLSDKLAKVLLKDIASVELVETTNLMPLDEKFLTVRDGAVKCHLSGITAPGGQNVWPGIATEVFQEELDKFPQKYMSKMGDILNDSLPVELFVKSVTIGGALEPTVVDWKTINNILIDRGFALPVRNKGKESQVVTSSELLKVLEDRPTSSSMDELVTNWLNKTQQASKHVPSNNIPLCLQYPSVPVPRRPRIPAIIDRPQTIPKTLSPKSVSSVMQLTELKKRNNQDALMKSLKLPEKAQNGLSESCKSSNSQNSSPTLNLSVKSLELVCPSPHLSRPIADMNTISEWLPAVPFKSLKFTAYPTYVDSECNIYLQDPSQSKDTLEIIQNALASRYKDSKPLPVDLYWFPGQLCIAQYFSDKSWYRAKVLKVVDNITVEVQFVDYGNIESCKASELRKNIFMGHIPIQCHRCTTSGIIPISPDGKWPVQTLDFIHGTIVEKMCKVELKEPDMPDENYVVLSLLCPGDLDLMEILLNMHYATYFIDCDEIAKESALQIEDLPLPTSSSKNLDKLPTDWYTIDSLEREAKDYVQTIPKTCLNDLRQNPLFQNPSSSQTPIQGLYKICEDLSKIITECNGGLTYKPAVLPETDECTVEVTGVLSAVDFVVQIVDCDDDENLAKRKDDFEELTQEMQTEAEKLPLLQKISTGAACCARYTQDGIWYRAAIMEQLEDGKFNVQYVDFGNAEILTRDRIREIKEKWTELPLQGVSVHLWGVHKPRNFNPEKTGKMIIEHMLSGDEPLIMKIKDRIGRPSVQFFNKEGLMVVQPLIDEKLLLINTLP